MCLLFFADISSSSVQLKRRNTVWPARVICQRNTTAEAAGQPIRIQPHEYLQQIVPACKAALRAALHAFIEPCSVLLHRRSIRPRLALPLYIALAISEAQGLWCHAGDPLHHPLGSRGVVNPSGGEQTQQLADVER
jgi:hypothetical protein